MGFINWNCGSMFKCSLNMFSPEFTGGNLRVLSMAKIATICNEQNEGSIISPFFLQNQSQTRESFFSNSQCWFLGEICRQVWDRVLAMRSQICTFLQLNHHLEKNRGMARKIQIGVEQNQRSVIPHIQDVWNWDNVLSIVQGKKITGFYCEGADQTKLNSGFHRTVTTQPTPPLHQAQFSSCMLKRWKENN